MTYGDLKIGDRFMLTTRNKHFKADKPQCLEVLGVQREGDCVVLRVKPLGASAAHDDPFHRKFVASAVVSASVEA